jgi:hypothetical protein
LQLVDCLRVKSIFAKNLDKSLLGPCYTQYFFTHM